MKAINATIAAANSGITVNIENSGIVGVKLGVGVDRVEVGVAGVDASEVSRFEVGLVDDVGVEVGLVVVEIRFW